MFKTFLQRIYIFFMTIDLFIKTIHPQLNDDIDNDNDPTNDNIKKNYSDDFFNKI